LEETHVNLNQGAESTISYLMARLTVEKYKKFDIKTKAQLQNHNKLPLKQQKQVYQTSYKKESQPIICLSMPSRLAE
jgi:hypothetical protein